MKWRGRWCVVVPGGGDRSWRIGVAIALLTAASIFSQTPVMTDSNRPVMVPGDADTCWQPYARHCSALSCQRSLAGIDQFLQRQACRWWPSNPPITLLTDTRLASQLLCSPLDGGKRCNKRNGVCDWWTMTILLVYMACPYLVTPGRLWPADDGPDAYRERN